MPHPCREAQRDSNLTRSSPLALSMEEKLATEAFPGICGLHLPFRVGAEGERSIGGNSPSGHRHPYLVGEVGLERSNSMPFKPTLRFPERGSMPIVPEIDTAPFPVQEEGDRDFCLYCSSRLRMFSPFNLQVLRHQSHRVGAVRSLTRIVYSSTSICFKEISQGFSGLTGVLPAF